MTIPIRPVKAALHKTGQVVPESHLHHCDPDGIHMGKHTARHTIARLAPFFFPISKLCNTYILTK